MPSLASREPGSPRLQQLGPRLSSQGSPPGAPCAASRYKRSVGRARWRAQPHPNRTFAGVAMSGGLELYPQRERPQADTCVFAPGGGMLGSVGWFGKHTRSRYWPSWRRMRCHRHVRHSQALPCQRDVRAREPSVPRDWNQRPLGEDKDGLPSERRCTI